MLKHTRGLPLFLQAVTGSLGRHNWENTRGAFSGLDDVLTVKTEDLSGLSSPRGDAFLLVRRPGNYPKSTVTDEDNARGDLELTTVGDVFVDSQLRE